MTEQAKTPQARAKKKYGPVLKPRRTNPGAAINSRKEDLSTTLGKLKEAQQVKQETLLLEVCI